MREIFQAENNEPDSNGYLSDTVRTNAKRSQEQEPSPTYRDKMLAERDAFRAAKKREAGLPE